MDKRDLTIPVDGADPNTDGWEARNGEPFILEVASPPLLGEGGRAVQRLGGVWTPLQQKPTSRPLFSEFPLAHGFIFA